ncbi:hypothetical protein C8R44DRAFT_747780 [Mycena epipterygia]|nr:hypothetical protein C8R44DRAFT_747780 [Mycena epipterygia]
MTYIERGGRLGRVGVEGGTESRETSRIRLKRLADGRILSSRQDEQKTEKQRSWHELGKVVRVLFWIRRTGGTSGSVFNMNRKWKTDVAGIKIRSGGNFIKDYCRSVASNLIEGCRPGLGCADHERILESKSKLWVGELDEVEGYSVYGT